MELIIVASVVGVLVAFGIVVVVLKRAWLAEKRERVRSFRGWARSRGWTYEESDPSAVPDVSGGPFAGIWRADIDPVVHVFRGQHRGHQLVSFEFRCESRQPGAGLRTYLVTVVETPAPRPFLHVDRERTEHRLLELVGIRDLQLENAEFNRTFRIATDSDQFAYDVLHPQLMEWFLADPKRWQTPFRFEGSWLFCWGEGVMETRYVLGMANFLVDILEQVPEHVWK